MPKKIKTFYIEYKKYLDLRLLNKADKGELKIKKLYLVPPILQA